ncbi:hypothetical protein M8J77_017074 [Diaphorina citri]|nr:hypothetical protein M8J77_017074 [Diaphorina citri]
MNAPSQCSDKCNSTAKSNIEKSDKASVAKSNELDSTVTEGDILDQLFDQHCLEASGKIDTQAFDQRDADCSTSHTITGLKPISKHWLKTYSGKKKENTVKKKQPPDDSNDQVQSKLVIPRQEPKNLPSDAQLCTNKSLIISNKLPVQKSVQGSCVKVILPSNYPIKILDTKGNLISKPPPILSANIELLKGFRIFRPSLPALASFTSTSVSSQIANQDKETRVPPVNIKPVIQLTEEETPKTEPCINNVQIDSSAKISQDKRSKSPKHVTPCVRIENNQVPSNSKKSNRTLPESRKKERRKSDKIDPVLERTEALRLCIKNHVDLLKNTNAEQPTQVECESGQPNDNMINNQNVIKSTEIMADKERVQSSEVLVEPVLPEEESREVEETSSKEKDLTRSEQESVEKTVKECNSSVEKLERKSKCEVKNKCEELERVPRDNMPEKHLDIGLSEELNLEKKSLGILETEVKDQSSNQINLSDIKLVSTEGTIKLNNPPSKNLKTTSDTRQKNVDNESSDLNKIPTGESLKQSENSDSDQQKEESQRNIENSVKDELKNSEVLDDNNVLQRSEVAKSEKMSTSHTEKIPKKTSKVTGTKDDHVKKQPTLLRRRKRKSVDKTEPLKSERNTKMKQQTEKSTSKTLEKKSSKDGGEKVMKAQIGSKSTRDQKEHQKEMLTNSADDLPEKELVVKNQENQQGQMEILKSFREEKVNKGCHKKELISNSVNTSIYKQGDEVSAEKDEVQSSEALAEKDVVQSSEVLAEKDVVQSSEVLAEKDEVQSSEVLAEKDEVQSSEVLAEKDEVQSSEVSAKKEVIQSSEVLAEEDVVQSSEVLAEKDVEQSGEVLSEKDEVQNSEVLAEENVQSSEVLSEKDEVQSSEVSAKKEVEQSSEVLTEKDEVQSSEVLAEKDEVQSSEVLSEKDEVQSSEVSAKKEVIQSSEVLAEEDVVQSSEVLAEKDVEQSGEVLTEKDEVQNSEVLAEENVVQSSEVLAEENEVQSSEVLAEKDVEQSSEVLTEKDEVQSSEVLAEKDVEQSSEVLTEKDEVQNSEVLAEEDEVQSSEVLAEKDVVQSIEVLAEKDVEQSSEVLTEKDEVQSSEVLAEKDEVQNSEVLAEKDEVQDSEVLAENDEVQNSEVLAEKDEVQSSEVLAKEDEVQSSEVLAEKDEVQSSEVLAEKDEVQSSEVLAEKDEIQSSEVLAEKDEVQSSEVLAGKDVLQSSEVSAEEDEVQSSEVLAEEDEVKSSEVLAEKDEVQSSEVLAEKDVVQSSEVLAEEDEVQSSEVLAEKDEVQSSEVLAEKDVVQSSEVLAEKVVEQSSEVLAEKDVVQSSEVLAEKDVVQSSEVLSEKNEVQSSEVLVGKSPLKETDIKEEGAQILNVQDLMGTNNTEEEKNNPSERLDGCDKLEQKAEPIELESTREDENEVSNMVSLESSHVTLGRDANIGTRKRKESGGEDSIERKKRKSACALEARSEVGDFSPENLKTKSLVPSASNRLLIHNEGIRDSSERNEEEPVNTDRMETKLLVQNKHTDTPATDVKKDSTIHNESVTIVSDKTDSTKICLNYDETESHIAPELNSEKTPIVAKNEKPVTVVINEHEDLESPRKNLEVHQVVATKTEVNKNHPTKSVDHEELNPNRDLLEFLELDNLSKKITSESTHVGKLGETDDMIESVDAIKKFMDDFNSPEKAQVIDLAGVGSKTSINDGTTDLQMIKQIRKPDSSTNPEHLVPKSLEKTNGDNSESNNFEMSNPEHNTDTSISIEQEEKELFEFNQNKPLVQVSKDCTNSKTKTSVNIEEDKTQAPRKFDQNIAPTKSRVKLRRPGPKNLELTQKLDQNIEFPTKSKFEVSKQGPNSKTEVSDKMEKDTLLESPLQVGQKIASPTKSGVNVRKPGPKSKTDSLVKNETDRTQSPLGIDQKTGPNVRKIGPKSKKDSITCIELDKSGPATKIDQKTGSPTKSAAIVRKPGPKSKTYTSVQIELDESELSPKCDQNIASPTKSGNVRKPGPKSRTETLGTIDLARSQSPLGSPTESEVNTKSGNVRKPGPKCRTETLGTIDLDRSQPPLESPTESEVIVRKLGPKTRTDTCTELDKTELSSDQSSPKKRKPCPKSKAKQSLENETELTHFDQDNSQLSATCEFEGNKSYTKNMADLPVHISENTKDCTLKKDQDSTQTGVKVSDSSVVEKSCTRSSVKVRKLCPKSKKFVFNVSETKESCASNPTLKENSQEVPTNCLPISKKESILMSKDSNDLEIMPEQGGECQKSPEFCEQESEKDGENHLDSASKILNLPKSSKETGKKSKDFTKDILHSSETIDSGIGIIDSKSADTKSVPILENITFERDTEKDLNNDSNIGIHPKLSIDTEPLAIPENVEESVAIHEHIEKSVPNPEKVEDCVVIPESTEESVPISDNIEKAMPNPQSTEEFVPIIENIEESEPIPDNSEESKTISEKVEDSVIIPENTDQSVPSPEITKKSEPIPANIEEFKIISKIVEDSMPIPESTEESIPILVNIEESMSIPENTEEYLPIPANTEEYVPGLANTDGSEPIPEKVEESVAIHKTSEESDIISESTDDSLIIPGNVGKSVAVPETIQEFVQIPKNVEVSTAIPTNVAKFLSISDYIKKSKQVPRHIEASVAKSKNLKESVATSENIEEAMEIPKNTEECDTIPENLEESLKYIETIEESLKIIENIEDSLETPKNTEEIVLILEKTKAFVPIPENIEKCEPIHKNIEESNPNPENIDNTVNILENIEGETINIPKSIEKVLENTKMETLTSSKNFSREPNIPENSQEMENKFDNTELPIPTASEKIITENIMDYGKVETDSKTVDSGNAPVIDTGIRSQNSLEITESSSTGTFETALDSKNFIPEQHEDNRGTISPTSTDLSGVEKMLSHQNRLTSKIDLKKMSIVNHANEESNNESNSNRGDTCALNEAPEEKVNYLDRYGIQHCYVNLDTIHIEGNTVSGTLLEKILKKCRNKQEKRIICQRAKLKRELNRNQSIKPDVLSDDDYVFSDEEPVENYKRQRHEQKGKFFTVVSLRNKEVIKYLNCSSSDSEESDDNYSLCSDGPLSNEPDSESEENEIDTRDTKSTQNLDIKNVRVMLEPIDHLLAQNNSIKLNPKILKELDCKVKRKELINKGIQVANKENQLCSQSDKPSEMLNNSMDEFKQKIHPKLTIKKVRSKCQNERFHPIVNPPCEAIQHDPKVIKPLEFEEKRKALDKEIEMFLRKDTNVRLVSSETEVPFDHKRKSTLHVDLEKKYSGSENKESPKSVQHLLKTPHSKDIKTSGKQSIQNATSVNAVSCVSNCQTSTPSKQLNTVPIKLGRPRKLIPPFKNVTLTKTVPKNTSCSKTNVSAISSTNVVKGKPRVKLIRPQIKKVIVEHLNKKEKGPATDRKLSDMYPSQNKKTDETKISETSTKDNEILQEPSVKCMLTQHQTTAPCGSTPPQHFEKTCQVKAQNENYKPESNGISVAKYSEMTNLNELSVDFDHSFPTPSKPSLQSSCSNPNLQLDISDSTLQDTFPYVEADALEDLFPDSVLNTTELFPQATSSELLLNLQEVSKVDSQVTSTVTDTSIAFPTYQSQDQTNINTFVATPHPPDSLFNNVVLEPPVKSHQMNSDPSNTKSPKLLTQKLRALRPFQGSSQNKTSSTALTKEDGTSSIESSKQATLDEPLSSSESMNSNSNQSQYDVKVSSNMFDINFHETIPSSPAVNPKPVVNATPPSNSSTSFLVPRSLSTSYASLSCPSKTFVNINSNPIPSISLVNSTPEPNIPITFFNINIVGSPSTSSLSVVSEQKSPNSPLQVASTSNTSHILNITPVSSCATSFNNMAPSSSTSYMTIVPQEPNPMMSFNSNEQCLNMENSLLVPNMEANSLNSTAPAITLTESNAIKFGSNISSQDNYGTSHVITYNTFESPQKETQYSTQQVNHSFLQPMDSFPDSLVSQQTSDLNKASPSNKTSPKSPRKAQKRKSPCVSSSCYSSAINSVISTYSNNFSPNIPNEYCPSVDKIKLSPLPPIQSLNSTLPVFQVPSNNDINIIPATPIQMSINTAKFNIPVPSPSIPTAPDNKNENLYNYSTFSGQTLESSLNQASASNKTEKQESLIDGNYAGAEFQALTDWVLDEYFQIPKDILASNPLDSLVLPDTATAASSIETISSQLEASCQANDLLNMPSTSTQNSVDVVTSEYPPKHDTNESLSTLDKTTRLHRVYQILDTKSKQNRQWNQSGILRANHSYENVRHYRRLSDGHSNNLMIRLPAATTLTPVQSSCTKTITSQSIKRKPTHEMSDQFKKQKVNHSNKDLNIVTKSSEYIAKSLPAKQSEVGETKQITKLPSKENTAPPRSQEVSNVRQSTSYPALSTTLVSHEAIVTSRESVITENTVKCHQQDPTKQGLIQNEQTNNLGNTEKGCRSIDKNLKSVHMKQLPNSNMKYRFIGNTLQPSTSVDNQTKPQLTLNITPNQGVIIPESGSTNIYPERGRLSSKQKSSRKCDDRQRPSEEKKHDINSLIEQQLKTVKKFCSEKNMNRYVSAKSKGPHTEAVSKKSVFNTGDFCIKSHDLFKPCPPLWKVNIEDKNITEFVYVLVDQEDEGKYSFIFKKNSCIGNFHSEDTNLWIKIYIGMEADSIQLDQVKNEQILEKFVIEKSFVVSSAYRNSFNLYVQVIISQAMNSNFLPYIEQGARDTCFFYRPWCEINAILKQYMKTMNRCFLLYDEQIVEALIRYPYCILAQGEQSAVQDNYTCPLCARSMCKVKMILKGPFYDRTNLASLDNHADRKETYLCEECGNLCVLFSKAVHFTYLAYQLALKAVKTQYPAAFESNDLKQNSPAESKLSETSCNAGVESRKEGVSTSSAEPSANTIPLNKSILNDEKFYLDLFRYFQTVLSYIDYCEYFILSGPYIFRRRLKRDLDDFTVEVTYEMPEEKKKENSSGEKQETADKEVKTDEKKEDRNGERKEGKDHKPEETIEKKDNGNSERKEEKFENKSDRNGERNDGCKKEEKKEDGKEETAGNNDMRKEETKCESKDSRREIEKTGDGKHQRIVRTKEERKDRIKGDINFKKTDEKCK